jgi:hypothetical protein
MHTALFAFLQHSSATLNEFRVEFTCSASTIIGVENQSSNQDWPLTEKKRAQYCSTPEFGNRADVATDRN